MNLQTNLQFFLIWDVAIRFEAIYSVGTEFIIRICVNSLIFIPTSAEKFGSFDFRGLQNFHNQPDVKLSF